MAQIVHSVHSIETLDHLSGLQLANLCGLQLSEVRDLVDYGALQCAFAREGLDYFDGASLSHNPPERHVLDLVQTRQIKDHPARERHGLAIIASSRASRCHCNAVLVA